MGKKLESIANSASALMWTVCFPLVGAVVYLCGKDPLEKAMLKHVMKTVITKVPLFDIYRGFSGDKEIIQKYNERILKYP